MSIERFTLCLNTDDPIQKELFEFITKLPNGKKRNVSAFLKLLVDREYQKKKGEMEQIKKAQSAPRVEVIKSDKGGIKYLASQNVNQNSDSSSHCTTD